MAYTITLSDGTFVTLIPDLTINNTAMPINLFGRGFVDYGMPLDENFVFMLEHFADGVAPSNPLVGQLWYNNVTDVLYLRSVTDVWVPIQTQIDPVYKEITVMNPPNENSAELDGTGNLYLQTDNPTIGFLTNFASPLSSGTIIASITLTSGGILQIKPGLSVAGNEVIQGSLDVSGSVTTGSMVVVNSTTTSTLNVSGHSTMNGALTVAGGVTAESTISAAGLINSSYGISAYSNTSSNSANLQNTGNIYLIKTNNNGYYAELDFDDGTGLKGKVALTNVGNGVNNWNIGAPDWPGVANPYVVLIQNGLEVIGNQLITGNLTVDGTVTSANSGNFVPISGGTMTGGLVVNSSSGISITSNTPAITMVGTSSEGTHNGTASVILNVDDYAAALVHYIDNTGAQNIYLGVYGGGLWFVNLTDNLITQFCEFILNSNQETWVLDGSQIGLAIYSHAAAGGHVPGVMLCDPGTTGGNNIDNNSWAMGVQMAGNNNGSGGGSNNYQLQWGNFDGNNGLLNTALMIMDYQGNVSAHSFTPTSDPKLKDNIIPLHRDVANRLLITPTHSYNMKNDSRTQFGVVADEKFELLWPELVHKRETIIDGADTEIKTVNYNGLIAPLIELVKSQEERIKALEAKISELLK